MPTRLTRTVVRQIEGAAGPADAIIVRLEHEGVYVRIPRSRTWLGPVSYGRLMLQAGAVSAGHPDAAAPRKRRRRSR